MKETSSTKGNKMNTVKAVIEAMQKEYKAVFPKSHTYIVKSSLGCRSNGIDINDTENYSHALIVFASDKDSFPHGIEHNDPFRFTYWIHNPIKDGKVIVECDGTSFLVKVPREVSIYECERVKIPFRKKNSTPEKVVKAMRKHFDTVRKVWDERKAEIRDAEVYTEF